jgi:hypothetical protein
VWGGRLSGVVELCGGLVGVVGVAEGVGGGGSEKP